GDAAHREPERDPRCRRGAGERRYGGADLQPTEEHGEEAVDEPPDRVAEVGLLPQLTDLEDLLRDARDLGGDRDRRGDCTDDFADPREGADGFQDPADEPRAGLDK